ncbi:SLATT domain-containing protein [Micromonospora parva]|uniref:SLATT domain-containing protein n=1 Tax=Micromonospora parva TaxID=1464048 RepID=UPI0033D0733A
MRACRSSLSPPSSGGHGSPALALLRCRDSGPPQPVGAVLSDTQWTQADKLLQTWLRRAREGQHSHHEAGKFLKRANYWLAVPVIVITTALGTGAFATLTSNVPGLLKITFGVLSIAAAILSALQIHLRFPERAEKHKTLGAQYGNVRRRIEAILATPHQERGDRQSLLDEVRGRFDALSSEGDVVSRRIFDKTLARLDARDRQRVKTED